MVPDKIVFDIETKNSFADVGGDANLLALDCSFVGAYSYNEDKYYAFHEKDFGDMSRFFKKAGLLIGFSSNCFDVPILNKYVDFDLFKVQRLDLLEEIELVMGQRIGLDILARTNLGTGKTSHGLEAIKFYKEGDLKSLESYCLNDVKITKELYELAKSRGYLIMPERKTGNLLKATLKIEDLIFHPTLF